MNSLETGGLIVGILYVLYQVLRGKRVDRTIEDTAKEDKSLAQQQFEKQANLAKVNRELKELADERERLEAEPDTKTDQEKADEWNKPQS